MLLLLLLLRRHCRCDLPCASPHPLATLPLPPPPRPPQPLHPPRRTAELREQLFLLEESSGKRRCRNAPPQCSPSPEPDTDLLALPCYDCALKITLHKCATVPFIPTHIHELPIQNYFFCPFTVVSHVCMLRHYITLHIRSLCFFYFLCFYSLS